MKARTIVALVIAVVLIVAGGVMLVLGLSYAGTDFEPKVAEKTYVMDDPFRSIQIETDTCDVVLVKTDGEFRAVCPDSEKLSCAVIAEEGVLKVSIVDIRHWTDMIGVFHPETQITVYLPESQYQALRIETDTGDVTVPEDFSFADAEILSNTGDVHFTAEVANLLTVTTTAGDITVFGSSPAVMRVTATTGDIILDEITGSCEFALCTTTGDVQAQNVDCEVMACTTTTGRIDFYRLIAQGYLGLFTDTGDIELEDCDSAEVTIETDTGDVKGHFLSAKWFLTESDTGDVDVPLGREGGQCRITTDTGDITFY